DQLLLGGAAADVLDGRVDEPDADAVLRARPAVGGDLVRDGGVTVLVLDRVLVGPLGQDALLLGVDDHAGAPVPGRAPEHVAVGVHRHPVHGLVELGDVTALRHVQRAVLFGVGEDRVDVDAAVAAAQRVTDFQVAVDRAAGRRPGRAGGQARLRVALGDALDGHLA